MKPYRLQRMRRMILKISTAMLLVVVGSCVNVDAVKDGLVVQDGPVTTVSGLDNVWNIYEQ